MDCALFTMILFGVAHFELYFLRYHVGPY